MNDDIKSGYVNVQTPRKYRCSKGHEWHETLWGDRTYRRISFGGYEGVWCFECILGVIRAQCGTVEEVKP